MDLSIIIVSFNTKELTLACIESIYKNKSSLDLEVVVVDNNSKDGSVEELAKLAKGKKIILIKNKKNLGFSKANNQGMKVAKGKHVLLLNSDTKVKSGALENLVNFAENAKDAGVVGARLLNPDGSLQKSCMHFPTIKNAIREYWLGERGLFEKYAPKGAEPKEVEAVVGACFLITQKAQRKVGMLDERFFFYFEDIEFCNRVWQKGLKVYYLPGAEVVHYHGASGKSLAEKKNQWRRLIPSSKIYHGTVKHYMLTAVLWLGQKWQRMIGKKS